MGIACSGRPCCGGARVRPRRLTAGAAARTPMRNDLSATIAPLPPGPGRLARSMRDPEEPAQRARFRPCVHVQEAVTGARVVTSPALAVSSPGEYERNRCVQGWASYELGDFRQLFPTGGAIALQAANPSGRYSWRCCTGVYDNPDQIPLEGVRQHPAASRSGGPWKAWDRIRAGSTPAGTMRALFAPGAARALMGSVGRACRPW